MGTGGCSENADDGQQVSRGSTAAGVSDAVGWATLEGQAALGAGMHRLRQLLLAELGAGRRCAREARPHGLSQAQSGAQCCARP